MTLPIDVGAGADDYSDAIGVNRTIIDLTNPANLSGLITSIDVWAATDMTGFRVGTFFLVSGATYRCRSSASIGAITAGSKQTFPVNLPILVGDFIGFYDPTGKIEREFTGGSGIRYVSEEYIDPGDSTSYSISANHRIGLYGQGIVKGWCSK